ncbi:Hypothetical predicted protein, partial [Mytilus galloprovincialis]
MLPMLLIHWSIVLTVTAQLSRRMDGFKLYVSNASIIPPTDHLCYEDPDPGEPNITQTIPCYELGKYVIYYDDKGSTEPTGRVDGPVIELCYVAINDNIAYDGLEWLVPSGSTDAGLANDGIETTCAKPTGHVRFHVDLKEKSIVTGMYIILADGTTTKGYHTVYASNDSNTWNSGTVLYNGTSLPTDIYFDVVFRVLTYVPPVNSPVTEHELCEIGIIVCDDGEFGIGCANKCYCLIATCSKADGICPPGGCEVGFHGKSCNQECNSGTFGQNCKNVCEGCISSMCDRIDGLCYNTSGCEHGYLYDKYCNKTCDDGHFGKNCTGKCSCLTGTCDISTGICGDEFQIGSEQTSNVAAIGGSVAAFIIGVLIIVAVFIFYKRRLIASQDTGKRTTSSDTTTYETRNTNDNSH